MLAVLIYYKLFHYFALSNIMQLSKAVRGFLLGVASHLIKSLPLEIKIAE